MDAVWTMLVPFIVILVARKAFKALGLGDLMNPISAMSLATGGAGRMMGDKDSMKLARGLPGSLKSAATSPLRGANKAAKWAQSDKLSRKAVRAGASGLGKGVRGLRHSTKTAASLFRKEKRAELAEKLRRTPADGTSAKVGDKSLRGALARDWAQTKQDFADGKSLPGARLTSGVRGVSNVLGARWRDSAAVRGKALTAGEHMLSVLSSAGVTLLGEGYPDLSKAMDSWSRKLSPDAPEKISRQYDLELKSRTARLYDDESIGLETARLGAERQAALTESLLGPDFGGVLSPASIEKLAHNYAQMHGISRSHVMVDAATGYTALMPAGENRIPLTRDPAVLMAYASNPLTWLSPEITARRPQESDGEHAFRMRATLDRAGLLDIDGNAVDMVERLDLEPGPELHEALAALAAGKKSDLRDLIGIVDPTDQGLRDVDMNVRHNFTAVDSPRNQQAFVGQLQQEVAQVKIDNVQIDKDMVAAFNVAGALTAELSRAQSPMELVVSVDKFGDNLKDKLGDVFGKIGDQMVTLYSAAAASGADPSEVTGLIPDMDKFQDKITADMEKLMAQLGDQIHALRSSAGAGDAQRQARELEKQIEEIARGLRENLNHEIDTVTRSLADTIDRQARLNNSYGNGVPRPGNYANAAEPPDMTRAA